MDPGIWGALTMLLHIYPDVMPAKSKGSLHGSSYGCIVVASAEARCAAAGLRKRAAFFPDRLCFISARLRNSFTINLLYISRVDICFGKWL